MKTTPLDARERVRTRAHKTVYLLDPWHFFVAKRDIRLWTHHGLRFDSWQFISQISSDSYPLQNKTFSPVKKDSLYYTVTLKRTK